MASTYLTRAFSSNTSSTKCTWSFWVKFSAVNTGSNSSMLFEARNANNSSAYRTFIRYGDNATLDFLVYNGSSSLVGEYYTKRKFRDCNSWYHICYSIDTTLSTASDRLKLYVNGVRETEFITDNYTELPQNEAVKTTSSVFTDISRNGGSAGYYFNGILSHYILTDGYVYQADTFGSTDTTTGEWKINADPTISNWGSNGFWILKDGNSVTDSSPNSNTFTVGGGTLTSTKDSPSNVFATLNPLDTFAETDYSNGNTKSARSAGSYRSAFSTLGFTTGKYYAEFKVADVANGNGLGVLNLDKSPYGTYISSAEKYVGINDNAVGLFSNILYYNNVNQGGTWTSWSNGNIIGLAVDATNGYAYWSVNGTWQNSGNPTAGTGGYALSNIGSNGTYVMGCSNSTSSTEVNFGNGYFGTTAVTTNSGNGYAGAEGASKFNYQPPTGYSALNTKGLNA